MDVVEGEGLGVTDLGGVLALPLPGGDVGEVLVVALGLAFFGLVLLAEVAAAREVVREQLAAALAVVPVERAKTWVGVAGTFTTLAALAHKMTTYDSDAIHLSRVGFAELLEVCEQLIAMTRTQRAALGPMHEGRVDVIGGGAIVVQELAAVLQQRAGIGELIVSEHDILDGIALSIP